MPGLSFEIDTSQFLRSKGNLVGQFRAMRDAALHAIDRSASVFIDEMKKRIQSSPPTGRMYWFRTEAGRGTKRMPLVFWKTEHGTYIASEEDNPPRILSGNLMRSFEKRTFFSAGHTRIISHIENTAPYALYLEYGAPVGGGAGPWPRGYMAPRPFMAPVIFNAGINHRMLIRVRQAMKRAGQAHGARQ